MVSHKQVAQLQIDKEIKDKRGYQLLTPDLQKKHFAHCVYVRSLNKILTPEGDLLGQSQFNASYGGFNFQADCEGKTEKQAWNIFTESQCLEFPKVQDAIFRPDLKPGNLFDVRGRTAVNTYFPEKIDSKEGDPTPLLAHVAKLLPDPNDQEILLNYMAACVQMTGQKFQWWPIIQGVKGNGKTFLGDCVEYAVGLKYSARPQAQDLASKFNAYLRNSVFILIEELRVPEQQREVLEVLKIMVTNKRQGIQNKGVDAETVFVCANGMVCTNYKDSMALDKDERRYALFYCAQQSSADIVRDGMSGDYFPRLYSWANEEGYAIVADYLRKRPIPDEFRRVLMFRAPHTSSHSEALDLSMGSLEHLVLDAINEGVEGFRVPYVSDIALKDLLGGTRLRAVKPASRVAIMKTLNYVPCGRMSRPSIVHCDGTKKPALFVRADHPAVTEKDMAAVMRGYETAQRESG